MAMENEYPEDIFHIDELSFSLSKDFSGGITEALEEVIKYLKSKNINEKLESNDEVSTIIEIFTKDNCRLSIRYGFMKKKDLTNSTYTITPWIQ